MAQRTEDEIYATNTQSEFGADKRISEDAEEFIEKYRKSYQTPGGDNDVMEMVINNLVQGVALCEARCNDGLPVVIAETHIHRLCEVVAKLEDCAVMNGQACAKSQEIIDESKENSATLIEITSSAYMKRLYESKEPEAMTKCIICQEILAANEGDDDDTICYTQCPIPHYLHRSCMFNWFSIAWTCPACKTKVIPPVHWRASLRGEEIESKLQEEIKKDYKNMLVNACKYINDAIDANKEFTIFVEPYIYVLPLVPGLRRLQTKYHFTTKTIKNILYAFWRILVGYIFTRQNCQMIQNAFKRGHETKVIEIGEKNLNLKAILRLHDGSSFKMDLNDPASAQITESVEYIHPRLRLKIYGIRLKLHHLRGRHFRLNCFFGYNQTKRSKPKRQYSEIVSSIQSSAQTYDSVTDDNFGFILNKKTWITDLYVKELCINHIVTEYRLSVEQRTAICWEDFTVRLPTGGLEPTDLQKYIKSSSDTFMARFVSSKIAKEIINQEIVNQPNLQTGNSKPAQPQSIVEYKRDDNQRQDNSRRNYQSPNDQPRDDQRRDKQRHNERQANDQHRDDKRGNNQRRYFPSQSDQQRGDPRGDMQRDNDQQRDNQEINYLCQRNYRQRGDTRGDMQQRDNQQINYLWHNNQQRNYQSQNNQQRDYSRSNNQQRNDQWQNDQQRDYSRSNNQQRNDQWQNDQRRNYKLTKPQKWNDHPANVPTSIWKTSPYIFPVGGYTPSSTPGSGSLGMVEYLQTHKEHHFSFDTQFDQNRPPMPANEILKTHQWRDTDSDDLRTIFKRMVLTKILKHQQCPEYRDFLQSTDPFSPWGLSYNESVYKFRNTRQQIYTFDPNPFVGWEKHVGNKWRGWRLYNHRVKLKRSGNERYILPPSKNKIMVYDAKWLYYPVEWDNFHRSIGILPPRSRMTPNDWREHCEFMQKKSL